MPQHDPDRHAPNQQVLNSIATVGVVEPPVAEYTTQDSEHGFSEEIKSAAFSGALLIASPLGPAATVYLLYAAGSLGEGLITQNVAIDPQSSRQIEASLVTFNNVLTAMTNDHLTLQSALVSEGNVLPAYTFTHLVADELAATLRSIRTSSPEKAIDALLQVSEMAIVFIKNNGSSDDDPILELKISLKLELKSADVLPRCLGWYANTWEGKQLRLSEWSENAGEKLKNDIASAWRDLSHEALNYLFLPRHKYFHFLDAKVVAPVWGSCSVKDPYERFAVYASYCPLADQGIAEYQSRIGNVFYDNSHLSRRNLVYAYIWYGRAAGNNDKVAAQRIRLLTSMLTPYELEEAENKLNEWKPGQCIDELTDTGLIRAQSR